MPVYANICAIDLFCGAGGMTYGLTRAGINVVAGIDIDPQVEYAFAKNNPGAQFLLRDLAVENSSGIKSLFRVGSVGLLAGCAPCKPFSKLNKKHAHPDRDLLDHFGRFVNDILPDLVVMENVPELADRGAEIFDRFLGILDNGGYSVDWRVVNCAEYGVPQARHRLVLLASRLGEIKIPPGRCVTKDQWATVRQTIGGLRPLENGEADPDDQLHVASKLSELNLMRIRATPRDGGSRKDWPYDLLLACHRRQTSNQYSSIYGRMWWDRPAPTITTRCTNIGNGRFGHPEQDRAITLREAMLLQSFPREYEFWPPDQKINKSAVARMIGNAVPPLLAEALGVAIVEHVHGIRGIYHGGCVEA